jgi:hypothetical protein
MDDRHDATFTVDPRAQRKRRRFESSPTDSWTSHSSPLEHYTAAVANCRYTTSNPADLTECQDAAWRQHLTACSSCAWAESWAAVVSFAAAIRADREARA